MKPSTIHAIVGGLSTALIVAGVLLATQTPPPITIILVSLGLGLREVDRRLNKTYGNGNTGSVDGNTDSGDGHNPYHIPIVKIG